MSLIELLVVAAGLVDIVAFAAVAVVSVVASRFAGAQAKARMAAA